MIAAYHGLLDRVSTHPRPEAAGETILGEVQTQRRLHSLYGAAKELGTTEELLELFLIEAGALDPGDPHYANRRVFPVVDFASLLAEIPTLVSLATLRAELGISRNEIGALVAEGILVLRCRSEIVRLRWSAAQAEALLSGLMTKAVPVSKGSPD